MRLHSFIVDYREEYSDPIPDETERSIFNEDMVDSGESAMIIGNDVRICGNILNHERERDEVKRFKAERQTKIVINES